MANSGSSGGGGGWRFVAVGLFVAALAAGYFVYRAARGTSGEFTYHPSTSPATQPTPDAQTRVSTSKPAPETHPTTTFVDVVRAAYPKYSATQPLAVPLRELSEAARIVLKDRVY